MKANERIKKAMKDNERFVMRQIRKYGVVDTFYYSLPFMKAADRLEKRDKIRYSIKHHGMVARNSEEDLNSRSFDMRRAGCGGRIARRWRKEDKARKRQ